MIAKSLLQESGAETVKIFYSYAHKDADQRLHIERSLGALDWDIEIRAWYDGEIQAGAEWAKDIDQNLGAADIVLLFVTQAFVDSKYCREIEIPEALRRHENGEARVIPILLEETQPDWHELDFSKLQPLPRNEVPAQKWDDPSQAFAAIGRGLSDLVLNGALPGSRWRWELHLEGEYDSFGTDEQRDLVLQLRSRTADPTLRFIEKAPGSILLTMESTGDALERILQDFENGDLIQVSERAIKAVLKLFGANVHASRGPLVPGAHRPDNPPGPEDMVLPTRPFHPLIVKSVSVDLDPTKNPIKKMRLIVDSGDSDLKGENFRREVALCQDYLITNFCVPDDDQFVNLAPDESARLLSDQLTGTKMGEAFLEFDYRLKKLAASLLHPDLESGRLYWNQVQSQMDKEIEDKSLIPRAYQRVWVRPEAAQVFETTESHAKRIFEKRNFESHPDDLDGTLTGILVERKLNVITERQKDALQSSGSKEDRIAEICDQAFRDHVLPLIQREVDEGKGFAGIRQVYDAMILGTWLKLKLADHPIASDYIDSGNPSRFTGFVDEGTELPSNPDVGPGEMNEGAPNSQEDGEKASLADQLQVAIACRSEDTPRSIHILEALIEKWTTFYGIHAGPTLQARHELAVSQIVAHDFLSGIKNLEIVIASADEEIGQYHSLTLRAMEDLATVLLGRGDDVRARSLQARASELRQVKSRGLNSLENRRYFEKYMDVFKNGVVYLERDEIDPVSHLKVRRVYFTGALDFRRIGDILQNTRTGCDQPEEFKVVGSIGSS